MDLTPKAHTAATIKRMQLSGSVPNNLNRNNDTGADNYGVAAARSSDASNFGTSGAPKSPHMGRPGRQSGGRVSGQLIRTRRTPEETARDIAEEDKRANALAKDREGRKKGGRIGRDAGGGVGVFGDFEKTRGTPLRDNLWNQSPKDAFAADDARNADFSSGQRGIDRQVDWEIGSDTGHDSDRYRYGNKAKAKGGRVDRARGGRTKGKTTVNVIIGGQKPAQPPAPAMPPPPPMAAPGPVGPPPGPPPGMGPPGGAPPGMGGPPPGGPPMLRARGGRIGKQFGGGMGAAQPQGGMGAATPMGPQGMPPQNAWKAPIQQNFDQARQAAITPGVGVDPAQMAAAHQARQQAMQAAKPMPQSGFQGDPNSLVPRGQTSGGVNQYYNPANGGMFVGNPYGHPNNNPALGGSMGGQQAAPAAGGWAQRPAVMATGGVARAKGGRVEISTPGKHDYGKAGVKHGKVEEEYGAGSGLGRQERARRQK